MPTSPNTALRRRFVKAVQFARCRFVHCGDVPCVSSTSGRQSAFVLPCFASFPSTNMLAFAGLAPSLPTRSQLPVRTFVPRCAASSVGKKVLIVNTKGGGHAVIGPHLAEKLLSDGVSVTVRQVGNENTGGPFARYSDLQSQYPSAFSLSYGPPDASGVPSSTFDAVYDNNSKSVDDAAAAVEAGKAGAELFYVSSAGAYKYDANIAPHESGDAAKGATIEVEDAMRGAGVSTAVFRPIYVIGPGFANRQYTDYFFDRIRCGRPILVPGTESSLVSLTDVRDLASMMAAALGKDFSSEIFNSVSPRAITVAGIIQMCAEVMGASMPEVVTYDPTVAAASIEGFVVKKAFPYRPRHFYANPFVCAKTADALGWEPEYSASKEGLKKSIADAYAEYTSQGLDKRDVDFGLDDKVIMTLSSRPKSTSPMP